MEQLEILARGFREAIERTPVNQLPISFQNFPAGACGDATLLLGHYLKAQGLSASNYVLGMRDSYTHAWLQHGEIIIDITADQFAEIEQSVIVTADPAWHSEFAAEVLHEADFAIYDGYTAGTLGAAYHTIFQHMEVPA